MEDLAFNWLHVNDIVIIACVPEGCGAAGLCCVFIIAILCVHAEDGERLPMSGDGRHEVLADKRDEEDKPADVADEAWDAQGYASQ